MKRMSPTIATGLAICLLLWGTAAGAEEPGDESVAAEETELRQIDEPPDIEQRWRPWQQRLELATAGTMALTAAGGMLVALNQPTLLFDGLCARGEPIFGQYGCDGLNRLHGIGGAATGVLYTSEQVMDRVLPGSPGEPAPSTGARIVDGIHLGGMLLMPLMGFLAAEPQTIGIRPPTDGTFPRTLRSVHASLGMITLGAYLTSLIID